MSMIQIREDVQCTSYMYFLHLLCSNLLKVWLKKKIVFLLLSNGTPPSSASDSNHIYFRVSQQFWDFLSQHTLDKVHNFWTETIDIMSGQKSPPDALNSQLMKGRVTIRQFHGIQFSAWINFTFAYTQWFIFKNFTHCDTTKIAFRTFKIHFRVYQKSHLKIEWILNTIETRAEVGSKIK